MAKNTFRKKSSKGRTKERKNRKFTNRRKPFLGGTMLPPTSFADIASGTVDPANVIADSINPPVFSAANIINPAFNVLRGRGLFKGYDAALTDNASLTPSDYLLKVGGLYTDYASRMGAQAYNGAIETANTIGTRAGELGGKVGTFFTAVENGPSPAYNMLTQTVQNPYVLAGTGAVVGLAALYALYRNRRAIMSGIGRLYNRKKELQIAEQAALTRGDAVAAEQCAMASAGVDSELANLKYDLDTCVCEIIREEENVRNRSRSRSSSGSSTRRNSSASMLPLQLSGSSSRSSRRSSSASTLPLLNGSRSSRGSRRGSLVGSPSGSPIVKDYQNGFIGPKINSSQNGFIGPMPFPFIGPRPLSGSASPLVSQSGSPTYRRSPVGSPVLGSGSPIILGNSSGSPPRLISAAASLPPIPLTASPAASPIAVAAANLSKVAQAREDAKARIAALTKSRIRELRGPDKDIVNRFSKRIKNQQKMQPILPPAGRTSKKSISPPPRKGSATKNKNKKSISPPPRKGSSAKKKNGKKKTGKRRY